MNCKCFAEQAAQNGQPSIFAWSTSLSKQSSSPLTFTSDFYFSPFHQSTSPALAARYSPLQFECLTAPQQRAESQIPSRSKFLVHFSLDKNRIQVTILVRDYCLNSLPPASLLAFLLFRACSSRQNCPAAGPQPGGICTILVQSLTIFRINTYVSVQNKGL